MPVGTGSINRAARSSKKTTEVVKNETKVAQDEIMKAEAAVTDKVTFSYPYKISK